MTKNKFIPIDNYLTLVVFDTSVCGSYYNFIVYVNGDNPNGIHRMCGGVFLQDIYLTYNKNINDWKKAKDKILDILEIEIDKIIKEL